MHRETSKPLSAMRVVIMQNFCFSAKLTRSLTFSSSGASGSRFFWVYGSAGLPPVFVLEYDMVKVGFAVKV